MNCSPSALFETTRKNGVGLLVCLLGFGLALPAAAQLSTSVWTGAVSTDWTDPANWDGEVPDADTVVVFDETTANLPAVQGTAYSLEFKHTLTTPFETTWSSNTINLETGGLLVEAGSPSIVFENSNNRGINIRRGTTTPFVNQSHGTVVRIRYMGGHGSGSGYTVFNGVGDFEIWQATGGAAGGWILHEDFAGALLAPGSYGHEASTYVNGGTLVLDGTLRSPRFDTTAFMVNQGGTVTGNGRIGAPYDRAGHVDIIINNGGIINPGRVGVPGTLTFENWDVHFHAGAVLRLDLLNAAAHDQLLFAKTGTHANNVVPTLYLEETDEGGVTLDLNLLPGFSAAVGDEFHILAGYAALQGHFAGFEEGALVESGGYLFRIAYGVEFVALTLEALPPPSVRGVQAEARDFFYYDADRSRIVWERPGAGASPVSVLLSKGVYPLSDGWLDAVIWLYDPSLPGGGETPADGVLTLMIRSAAGELLMTESLGAGAHPIPGHQLFLSYRLPDTAAGNPYTFEVVWLDAAGQGRGMAEQTFLVQPDAATVIEGRIPLTVANPDGIVAPQVPVTVGVPFPRGALHDPARLRLVDEAGVEHPVQTLPTAHWARFGSIRWLLCDFGVALDGGPRTLYLEYGPDVAGATPAAEDAEPPTDGFPEVAAGRLQAGPDGLDWQGSEPRRILEQAGLLGAFVERVDGTVFRIPADAVFEIEESGPRKSVVRARGWYEATGSDIDPFNQFDIRWLIYHDTPLVRVLHTWIYTGDSNEPADRIANMGWRFVTGPQDTQEGFLASFEEPWSQLAGQRLLQYDDAAFEVVDGATVEKGHRAPGVFSATRDGWRVWFGTKDFWQTYPSELAYEEDALVFYAWPRHGRPRREAPESTGRAWRLDFAHTGEVMDLSLPLAYVEDPIYGQAEERGHHFRAGDPASVSAQGLARTTEMWLHWQPVEEDPAAALALLRALDGERLRAVVDPAWLRATEAMYEIHPYDPDRYPEEEALYELYARKPMRQVEHMGVYGMWLWGDLLRVPNMEERTADLYRAFRKGHHGWPYSWIPFARSGDPEYFKFAEAATRYMTDVAFCHYFTEELNQSMPGNYFRARGWWNRNLIPWAGFRGPTTLMYTDGGDYLWHAWHLTGYRRARDVALAWAEEVRQEDGRYGRGNLAVPSDRARDNLLQQFTEWYVATWDPWFLVAANALADHHRLSGWTGREWRTGHREFHRWLGAGTAYDEALERTIQHQADQRTAPWADRYIPQVLYSAYGYRLTGETNLLRRVVAEMEYARSKVFEGDDPAYRGMGFNSRESEDVGYTGWFIQRLPYALDAITSAPEPVVPLNKAYQQAFLAAEPGSSPTRGKLAPRILIYKEAGQSLPVMLSGQEGGQHYGFTITTPDGGTLIERESLETVELEAAAEPGIHALRLRGPLIANHSSRWVYYPTVRVPVTPPGTPEVLEVPVGGPVPRGHFFRQYYFLVPADMASFWLEFEVRAPFREVGRRITIRDPDGGLAWDRQVLAHEYGGETAVRAEIEVAPEHRGRLWQVTLPGITYRFTFDPNIPPYFALDPDRWFMPELPVHYRAGPGGTITGPSVQTVPFAGTTGTVLADAEPGAVFSRWDDGQETASRQDEDVRWPLTVEAGFASVGGVPIPWYLQHGFSPAGGEGWDTLDTWDAGGKGLTLREEYMADLDPHDPSDRLPRSRLVRTANGWLRFQLDATSPARRYHVDWTPDLRTNAWIPLDSEMGSGNILELPVPSDDEMYFRGRISVP